MLLLCKPEPYSIRQYLNEQANDPFSYREVGATNSQVPRNYTINHTRHQLGVGEQAFVAARTALQTWQQLQLGWVNCWPTNAPLRAGENIAVIGRAFGLWWLNACRIAYTVDAREGRLRFGYAHGTLSDHLASGEERFLVEMEDDESVWIDILAFSRPNTALAKLGYAYMRHAQRRFGRESAENLARIVNTQMQSDASSKKRQKTVAICL